MGDQMSAPEDLPLRQSNYPSRMKDLPRPRRVGLRKRERWDIGPLRPALLYSGYSLRDGMAYRLSGGIGPPHTRPWHNLISPPA